MGSFSIWHWIIVLLVVAMVFGTKKLRNIGSDLGGAIKSFREGIGESSVSEIQTSTKKKEDSSRYQAKEKDEEAIHSKNQ